MGFFGWQGFGWWGGGQGTGTPGSWRGLAGGPDLSPSPALVPGPPTAASTRQQLLKYEIVAKAHRLGQLLPRPPLCFQRGGSGRHIVEERRAPRERRAGGGGGGHTHTRWAARAAGCLAGLGFPPLSRLLGTAASRCVTTQPRALLPSPSPHGGQLGGPGPALASQISPLAPAARARQ